MAKEYIEERDGNSYVAGTRISLDSIVRAFRRGESPETICQNFDLLRLEEGYGAIAHFLAKQGDIDACLIRQSEKWAEGSVTPNHCPRIGARDSCAPGTSRTRAVWREGSISHICTQD